MINDKEDEDFSEEPKEDEDFSGEVRGESLIESELTQPAPEALTKRWLLNTHSGTLCTIAQHSYIKDYPFGSIVPFALDSKGYPFILIAEIAAHTTNLKGNPKASLFVHDLNSDGDPQASWRVTIIGEWSRVLPKKTQSKHKESSQRVSQEEYEELHARYLERVPQASGYLKQHTFDYWRMNSIARVRFIGGFGEITWLEGSSILRAPLGGGLSEVAAGAITHMNEDHEHNLIEMCQGFYHFTPQSAQMISLDRAGFMVQTTSPDRKVFFSFDQESTATTLRSVIIKTLRKIRNESLKIPN